MAYAISPAVLYQFGVSGEVYFWVGVRFAAK